MDATELREFAHATELKLALTPDWNQTVGVRSITGYTTLLPADISQDFAQTTEENRSEGAGTTRFEINRLPEIMPDSTELRRWAVKYYLVDSWYKPYGEQEFGTLLTEKGDWKVYELPEVLPRVRFVDGTAPVVTEYQETPNSFSFVVESTAPQTLVIADRWDKNWQAWVNGEQVALENREGQRGVQVPAGTSRVQLKYTVYSLWVGALISLFSGCVLVMTMLFKTASASE